VVELGGRWETHDMTPVCGTPLEPRNSKNGRGDWIRTCDPCAQGKLERTLEVLFPERFAVSENS
jgi:hypothetical protein